MRSGARTPYSNLAFASGTGTGATLGSRAAFGFAAGVGARVPTAESNWLLLYADIVIPDSECVLPAHVLHAPDPPCIEYAPDPPCIELALHELHSSQFDG